jgi:hypothetical protein
MAHSEKLAAPVSFQSKERADERDAPRDNHSFIGVCEDDNVERPNYL